MIGSSTCSSQGDGLPPRLIIAIAVFAGSVAVALVLVLVVDHAGNRSTPSYYVSIGDSYAAGYQPHLGLTRGFTGLVADREHLQLVNFACTGATSGSVFVTNGCGTPAMGAPKYRSESQAQAAESFLRNNRRAIHLITVIVGGGDVTTCATATDPVSCVLNAVPQVVDNVRRLASALRADSGPKIPILGLTYPDVALGAWVYPPQDTNRSLATLSVSAFQSLINPQLRAAYASAGAAFVDVTQATGAYGSMSEFVSSQFGQIPYPVARVCDLTWMCSRGDIHPTARGYELISNQITSYLSKKR